ncbi:MAG: triphosphoribosyl-dephospho-CoA synthase [Acetobacteraceae bacterium]
MNGIEAAFIAACDEELAAPKPGNVHRHAGGHRMTVGDFECSARAAAPGLCRAGAPLGARILDAVRATRDAVGQNTNLGIVLLCAPLAMAAEAGGDLPAGVRAVIGASDLADAHAVFEAIRLAAPGGLGDAPRHDVRDPATVTLPVAMAEAAARDSIARQWSNGFADVLGPGLAVYAAAPTGSLAVYLHFLATFPDSHVQRGHGSDIAEAVRRRAATMRGADLAGLLRWDAELKARRINPGTSADLTVATAFAARLLKFLRRPTVDG